MKRFQIIFFYSNNNDIFNAKVKHTFALIVPVSFPDFPDDLVTYVKFVAGSTTRNFNDRNAIFWCFVILNQIYSKRSCRSV